jgi:sedoheptulokinase
MFTEHFSKASLSLLRPLTAEEFILVGSPLCGGRAYALLEGFFRAVSGLAGDGPAKPFYDIMADLAEDFLTLENPLVVATQFSGTRSQPDLRGSISNMGTDNFTPKHFTIGVLQGMVGELKELYETMASLLTHKPQMLIGSGNGIRMNKPLQQMIATSFNMPLHIPVCEEEAAYGASLFSLFTMGFFETLKEAQALIKYK